MTLKHELDHRHDEHNLPLHDTISYPYRETHILRIHQQHHDYYNVGRPHQKQHVWNTAHDEAFVYLNAVEPLQAAS